MLQILLSAQVLCPRPMFLLLLDWDCLGDWDSGLTIRYIKLISRGWLPANLIHCVWWEVGVIHILSPALSALV